MIYLPTRRAARAFAAIVATRNGGRAQLLPRIVPLGDADQAEFDLAAGALESAFEATAALAPPIAPMERRLILTRLVQRWAAAVSPDLHRLPPGVPFLVPSSPADAVNLAADLELLMDALAVEEVPWDEIAQAVESEYSEYFKLTLDFVRIAVEGWPGILAERGASDPAHRRSTLIKAEAERLLRERPQTPIIAAGSTGSMPSTAALLAAIARLPNGAVVLPGLDQDLDDEAWGKIGRRDDGDGEFIHGHPQAMLKRLVETSLQVSRHDVPVLGSAGGSARARSHILTEALRPAETTDLWVAMDRAEHAGLAAAGFAGVAIVEAVDEREEALAMAIALRETLEQPGHRAALANSGPGARDPGRGGTQALERGGRGFGRSAAVRLARRPPRPLGGRRGGAGFPSRPRARPPGSSAAPAWSRSRRGRARRRGARDRGVARTRPAARS